MKKILISIVVAFLFMANLSTEEVESPKVEIDIDEIMEESMQEVEEAMKEVEKSKIMLDMSYSTKGPKMGVYLSDLDFQDIYEMHYDYNYGVLITGVTEDGPAQKAGMMKGDIVMEFDGLKVKFEDHLVRLIRSHQIGDQVTVKFFRDENIYETVLTLDTLTPKDKDEIEITTTGKKKKRYSVGFGGGSWIPIWYTPDIAEINSFLEDMEFKEEAFSEDGFLIHGGGGKGNIGKGWFLGGMGAGYYNKESTKHIWVHHKNGEIDTTRVTRKAKYNLGFGGVTLDKRFAFSNKIVSSLGFMIGWGGTDFKITQKDKNGDLPNFVFNDEVSNQFDEYYDYKSKLTMKKDFFLFQPKIMLMYRILDWLAFRAEAGYLISYSSKGWKIKWNGESVKAEESPEYSMDGLTLSIGPWFGF